MKIKKLTSLVLSFLCFFAFSGVSYAITEAGAAQKKLQASPNARPLDLAFVFDGPSDKNAEVLKTFQSTITKSLLPDYKAQFPNDLVFVGDWSEEGAAKASEKALNSKAKMVVSLGYMSSVHLDQMKNKNKFVVTIGDYGLRDLGSSAFFNPLKQYVNDFILFKKLVPTQQKTAVLLNESFYKTQKDWNSIIEKKFQEKGHEANFIVLPVGNDVKAAINSIPEDVDSVFVTPMFNLTAEQRTELYSLINAKKLPSFSSVGDEDVKLGALLGTSTPDLDRKLAEATSFSIHGVLHGNVAKSEKLAFYDDEVIFYNKDTGADLGYNAPLRLLNNCQIISNRDVTTYDLAYILNTMEEQNLDIKRKKYLVDAARRATYSAYLKYLPTLRVDLGYQSYDDKYAKSYTDVPVHAGQFTIAMDQMIYAPDLVTNIIVKHKKLKFDKAEKVLTTQAMGLNLGFLYLDTLIFENMIKVQEEYVKETRENLAIARVREKAGKCGPEEALRWAGQVNEAEKKLLEMKAEYNNIRIAINQLLVKDQTEKFTLKPLTATDPAFFTSDIHIIDHVRTPEKLEAFTKMLVDEVIYRSPETVKLRAAIAMKKAEMANYAQKFILPNAKLSLEYGSQFDRYLPYEGVAKGSVMQASGLSGMGIPEALLDRTSGRVFVAAQWKPIEGGSKIAEIARCKAELNELKAYLEQVNIQLEAHVREVINRAIAKYFIIEKSYKAMFAEAENYKVVKAKYLRGQAPITQLVDAQELYTKAKVEAMNSQNEFFKELIWVQRGIININWTKADDDAKDFIQKVKDTLPAEPDFVL